jgi:hypothetical protein
METKHVGSSGSRIGILYVSLGASFLSASYLKRVVEFSEPICSTFIFCLLDVPEIINYRQLRDASFEEAERWVEARCSQIMADVNDIGRENVITRKWCDYAHESSFCVYEQAVANTYLTDSHYRKHVLNQTFRNLQPILSSKGVKKHSDELVNKLAEYLNLEISLKLFIANERRANIEFSPKPEMEIVDAIYRGKYSQLAPLTQRRLAHVVLGV